MRKIFMFVALIAASALSYAGPLDYVCGTKRTQQEVNTCVQLAVNGGLLRSNKNLERIYASGKVPQKEKESLQKHRAVWGKAVDEKCRDNVCVYDGLAQLNADLEAVMKKYGLQPY